MSNKKGQIPVFAKIAVVLIAVFLLSLILYGLLYDTVDANHIGVKIRMGKRVGIMNEGTTNTGIFVNVAQYSLMTRPFIITMVGDDCSSTKDGQTVYATVKGNWRIKSSAVEEIYKNVGADDKIYTTLNIEGRLKHGFKSVITQYNDGLDIIQNRDEVVAKAIEAMRRQFPNEYAELEYLGIDNIWYEEAYQDEINMKKAAEQAALRTQEEKKIVEAESQKRIINAEAEKSIQKQVSDMRAYDRQAQAEAQAFEIERIAKAHAYEISETGKANAYVISETGKAQAEAITLQSSALTPLYVANNKYESWNGEVPDWVTGDGQQFLIGLDQEG